MIVKIEVAQQISRYQVVEVEVPEDLLVDGQIPDFKTNMDAYDIFEQGINDSVYEEIEPGRWEEHYHESDWRVIP